MSAYLSSAKLRNFSVRLFRVERSCHFATLPSTSCLPKEDDFRKKIIYSSKQLENDRWAKILAMRQAVKDRTAKAKRLRIPKEPIAMRFLSETPRVEENVEVEEKEEKATVMPIALKLVSDDVVKNLENSGIVGSEGDTGYSKQFVDGSAISKTRSWKNDYVEITHKLDEDSELHDYEWVLKYGTSNVKIPSSSVPCGGCGALLHCKDPSIPGFIPQEVFLKRKIQELRSITCQRCYFLQNHDTALSVAVDSRIYPKIIASIKEKNALVLLAIDLTDFPCSIWPGITDLVGLSCPVFLVGNKVDLLLGDSRGWMAHVEQTLRSFFPRRANILGTQLISAKTGFGVEELISKLQSSWRSQGDVYLVGCTNVGKSTLFNALLQSDYCKVKAADLVQRATTAPWPGTTLNLLKFPIMRAEGWRLYLRSQRLKKEQTARAEAALRKEQIRDDKKPRFVAPQLIGHIGRTFHKIGNSNDPFEQPDYTNPKESIPGSGLNPEDLDFKRGRWFFDTPGVLHEDQILDLLTTDELVKVLPQKTLEPRTLIMKPGWTLFVGGIARVDFLSSSSASIKWTVFVSRELPLTVCFTEDAEQVYDRLSGTELFAVPSGDEERLSKWPPLQSKDVYKFSGLGKKRCCGDIVLSSCGWVSFAPDEKEIISVRPWTPSARGIYTRSPALLPYAVKLKGVLMRGSPAFSRPRGVPSSFYRIEQAS